MDNTILSPSMMITSIIGFILSAVYTAGGSFERAFSAWGENFGLSLGFSFCLVFLLMFVASMVTITPTWKDYEPKK